MLKVDLITIGQDKKLNKEECKSINLIIGSNNSGKTTFINEIYNELRHLHGHYPHANWIYGLKLSVSEAKDDIERIFPSLKYHKGDFVNYADVSENIFAGETEKDKIYWSQAAHDYLKKSSSEDFSFEVIYGTIERNNDLYSFFSFLTRILVKIENCVHRLDMKFSSTINDLNLEQNDFIYHLFCNRNIFAEIQRNVKEVYGLKIDFDNLQQGIKPIRIILGEINKKINNPFLQANEWKKKSKLLDSVGHGIRAYLQLVFTLLHPSSQIVLIDEPEMFIHPPQRRALGKLISKLAIKYNKQLFVATHDSEFMRGVLSASNDVKVFQLSSKNFTYRYSTITASDILTLIPKQSSNVLNERILNSLFYKKTILCENENDRVIYEEAMANYHWTRFHDVNFVGLNGKGMAVSIYNKLLDLNIAATIILDIDYLIDGQFPNIKDSLLVEKIKALRVLFKSHSLNNKSEDYRLFKKMGLKLFTREKYHTLKKPAHEVITDFKVHGIFIVPTGELESWTKSTKNDVKDAIEKIRTKKITSLEKFLGEIVK